MNVEVNLGALHDTSLRSTLATALDSHRGAVTDADAIVHSVRERISR